MRWTIEYIDGETVLDIDFSFLGRAGVLFPGPGNYQDACEFILADEDLVITECHE